VYLQFSEFLQNATLRLSTNKNAWKQHAPVLHFAPLWPDGEAQKVITLGILLFGRAPQVYYFAGRQVFMRSTKLSATTKLSAEHEIPSIANVLLAAGIFFIEV
jgi:hypothetical protein